MPCTIRRHQIWQLQSSQTSSIRSRPSAQCMAARKAVQSGAYDVLVVGLGAFGSAALYHMRKAGLKVAGIERFRPGHDEGSSHGLTRITRLAYNEGPEYVPLLKRSYKLHLELQEQTGQELFYKTGMLDIGRVAGRAREAAEQHNLPYEWLTGADVNRRFPGYQLPDDFEALLQPDGGILRPEAIVQAHCDLATSAGAEIHPDQQVISWRPLGPEEGVEVVTGSGRRLVASQLLLAAGPWMRELVPELQALCVPERQVVGWFGPADPRQSFSSMAPPPFHRDSFPVFIIEDEEAAYYGFPQYGDVPGFKIGRYYRRHQMVASPDAVSRAVTAADEAAMRRAITRYFPAADGPLLSANVCMFTTTPDSHFLIDRHPAAPQVMLCSACSGHGFKMAAGVGQLLADMAVHGGGGGEDAQSELALHRIHAGREGHQQFLDASGSKPVGKRT